MNIISLVVWWNPTPLPFIQRGTIGTQGSSQQYVQSSSIRTQTWDRLWILGYYWPKMVSDAIAYVRRYHTCQIHGDFIHQAPGHLHSTSSSWSFKMCGMDVIGPISPPTSKGYQFILDITDYSSKWMEVIPLKEVKMYNIIKFIKHHVIYHFGIPRWIIHDNGSQFVSQVFQNFCNKLRIQSVPSMVYLPMAYGSFQQDHWKTSQEVHLKKSTQLEREVRWMPLGLSHNGENPNKGYTIFLGVWIWSYTFIGDSNSISVYCLSDRDDEQG